MIRNPEYIDSIAPNEASAQNGRDLARKGRLKNLRETNDGTLLLGECAGSGKEDYIVSADFVSPESPVFRCTCPSRQYPCKHALGLLYAHAAGQKFESCDIPQEILDKREKAVKREQRKNEAPEKPAAKKVNAAALIKKIKAQIEGLDIFEKIVLEIASSGLGLMNRQRVFEYLEQARQLGDHYLPAVQAALRGFLMLFHEERPDEAYLARALAELGRLHAQALRGREYLVKKAEEPGANLDAKTEMEELLGNAWQLSQLIELGLAEKDAELVQLSFRSYDDDAAQEFVDEGFWVNLGSGAVVRTINRRPYKAAKYIKEEDSFFGLARVPELAVYPGECNPRVRWDGMTALELTPGHCGKILSHAVTSYADAVKAARNVLKNPLGIRNPAFLFRFARIGMINSEITAESPSGERLALADAPEFPPSVGNLRFLGGQKYQGGALLGVFRQETCGGRLRVHPLSVVWPGGVVRLAY